MRLHFESRNISAQSGFGRVAWAYSDFVLWKPGSERVDVSAAL
jgi:hypothetical protein